MWMALPALVPTLTDDYRGVFVCKTKRNYSIASCHHQFVVHVRFYLLLCCRTMHNVAVFLCSCAVRPMHFAKSYTLQHIFHSKQSSCTKINGHIPGIFIPFSVVVHNFKWTKLKQKHTRHLTVRTKKTHESNDLKIVAGAGHNPIKV